MEAFRLAKEATLRALDSPMAPRRWPAGKAARDTDADIGSSGSSSSDNSSGSRKGSSSWPEVSSRGVRLVEVRTCKRRGTDDTGEGVRSRL